MTPTPQVEAPPEEQQPNLEPYGPGNIKLPRQMVEALKSIIKEYAGQDKYTRRREVLHDRKNRFYERGYQHLAWSNGGGGGFVQAAPGGYGMNANGDSVQFPMYLDDYEIFYPYQRILMSVLTQSPPGVAWQPNDPSRSEDLDGTSAAEGYDRIFDRMNDVKQIQLDISRMFGLSGRTVSWTRTEEDAQKFGYNDDGSPRRFQKTDIYGTLETKVPIMCRGFDGATPYIFIYLDRDVNVAREKYPDFRDEIKAGSPGIGENAYERTARLGILNGTRSQAQIGDSLQHMVTEVHCFLRPAAFACDLCKNEVEEGEISEDGETPTLEDAFLELFPEGVRVCFQGETYVGSYAESMDDHIDIRWPYAGDGMFRQAYMDPMVVVQDCFNDGMNAAREKFDTGWGALWINADDTDLDAITSQRAAPNAIRGWKTRTQGGKLEDEFFKEEDPNLPATFMQFLQMIQGELPQFMLAAPPALFGAQMEDQKTASGYAQARSQAIGQLGIIFGQMQMMWARIRYQAALAASKEPTESVDIVIPGDRGGQNITVSLEKLRKGKFGCYPDEDSSFPESTQQKRATLQALLTMAGSSPAMLQLLDNPDNVEEIKRLNGFEELTLLPAEARNKQVFEIEILLTQSPIHPAPEALQAAQVQHAAASIVAQQSGGAPPPSFDPASMLQPSVPVDELDFHQWEFAKCQEWLSSAARRTEDAKGNQAGVLNVKLHAKAHQAAMLAQQAQMAALQPPPPAPAQHGKPPAAAHGGEQPQGGPPKPPPAPTAQPAI